MHDIWNPWHGCRKCSEGCANCYMYYLDGQRGKNGADIYRTKAGFRYPISKHKSGEYKVVSGEQLRVVDIPPGYTHNIENLGETDMVTVMWCSECFDPDRPDTYFLPVQPEQPMEKST